jgi:hypothetical protein
MAQLSIKELNVKVTRDISSSLPSTNMIPDMEIVKEDFGLVGVVITKLRMWQVGRP